MADVMTIMQRLRGRNNDIEMAHRQRIRLSEVIRSAEDQKQRDALDRELKRVRADLSRYNRLQTAESAAIVSLCNDLTRVRPIEGEILHLYYVRCMTIEAVGREMNYSKDYVRRVKRTVERRLEQLPDKEVRALLPDWYWKQEG